jgi:hypothetical protein
MCSTRRAERHARAPSNSRHRTCALEREDKLCHSKLYALTNKQAQGQITEMFCLILFDKLRYEYVGNRHASAQQVQVATHSLLREGGLMKTF